MIYFFLFVLGAIVGSFLNVVGLRWAKRSLGGRSECPRCHKTLRWFELIPFISFIVQGGRCRGCRTKISWQYPLVELWTGLIFVTLFTLAGFSLFYLLSTLIFCLYVVITIYDFKYKIIPDQLVYIAILLSVVSRWLSVSSTIDWLAGPILFAFFASIWLLSRGRAMGFGDAKLGLSVGFLLGAAQGFSAIILAFWIGALGSLIYMLIIKLSQSINKTGLSAPLRAGGQADFIKSTKGLTMKSEVPFAPAIILGAWISLMFHLNILNVGLF